MGCAFSSTQIFVLDSRRSRRINHPNIGIAQKFLHVRQGIWQHKEAKPTVGTTAFWLASTKHGNDAVLVGQLKSNGAHCRRRPSSEAQFIECSRRSIIMENGSPVSKTKTSNGNGRMLTVIEENNREQKKFATAKPKGTTIHYGLVDFQKRLERLKERKQQEEQQQHQIEDPDPSAISNNVVNDVKGTNVMKIERAPVEPLIVNHVTAIEESEEHDEFDDRELWREWDEMSADCCSILVGPSNNQQHHLLHDGEVSETSFVLVKKRLKVCWEHRQLHQMRKLSLLRNENWQKQQGSNLHQLDTKMNNWIPEITNEDE